MAAGLAQLGYLKEHPEVYEHLDILGNKLFGGIQRLAQRYRQAMSVNAIGSLGCAFFTAQRVTDYTQAKQSDTVKFADYFRYLLAKGIYVAPSQFEAMFLCAAHTEKDIDCTLAAIEEYFNRK